MFQTSLQSLLETTDQLMDLLAQNYVVYPVTTIKPIMKKIATSDPSPKSSDNESSEEETESKAER